MLKTRSKPRVLSPNKNWNDSRRRHLDAISVVILIRTDTTLDQSQKAEKVQVSRGAAKHNCAQRQKDCVHNQCLDQTLALEPGRRPKTRTRHRAHRPDTPGVWLSLVGGNFLTDARARVWFLWGRLVGGNFLTDGYFKIRGREIQKLR